MKRWTWAALAAAGLTLAGACGVVLHTVMLHGSDERGEHSGMRPLNSGAVTANTARAPLTGPIAPHQVIFRNLPTIKHPAGQDMLRVSKKDRTPGEEDEKRERSQITEAQADARREQAMHQPVKAGHIQQLSDVTPAQRRPGQQTPGSTDVVNLLNAFD